MKALLAFLRALFSKWWFTALTILSLLSTAATYIPAFQPDFQMPRWVPLVVVGAAWFIASYRVYCEQASRLDECRNALSAVQERKAALIIRPHGGTFYRLVTSGNRDRPYGIYVRLELAIENQGKRPSVISVFDLEIHELGKKYPGHRPSFKEGIQTPKTQILLGRNHRLSKNGYISVDAEKISEVGYLDFFVQDLPPPDCHVIHCTLTVKDTAGAQANHTFELPEH